MPRPIVARQAVLVALAGLIPVPFIDSWIQGRLRSELVRSLGQSHATPFEDPTVKVLTRQEGNLLVGCVVGVLWWPIKKLIRKVVYVLTVKDAIDAAADTFVRGEMMREALAAGLLPGSAKEVRAAMDRAMKTHARSPLWGPKTAQSSTVTHASDSAVVRALAHTADRAGGAAALEAFRTWMGERPLTEQTKQTGQAEQTEQTTDGPTPPTASG